MSHTGVRPRNQTTGQDASGIDPGDAVRGSLPVKPQGLGPLTSELCNALEEAGCPLAPAVQERLRFETLLADLSATFVNLPPDQVDAQINGSLRRLVEFLDVDRGGLAEVLPDRDQLVIAHSYHRPGTPPQAWLLLDEQLPWYARRIREGQLLRLGRIPDD